MLHEAAKDAAFTISSRYRVRLRIQRGSLTIHPSAARILIFASVTNSGSFRYVAAIRRASSSLSNFAAERRPDSLS